MLRKQEFHVYGRVSMQQRVCARYSLDIPPGPSKYVRMAAENPWKTVSSRIVYENPWMRVREDQVIRPDGKPGIYGVLDTRIATGVVALTAQNEVYLVGQYRYTTDSYSWEIIEGGTDGGESALEAAKRELKEEAGLTASKWEELGSQFHLSNCITSERAHVFLARGLIEGENSPEETEILTLKKVPFAEAVSMADEGEIVDAVTIIGLYRAKNILKL